MIGAATFALTVLSLDTSRFGIPEANAAGAGSSKQSEGGSHGGSHDSGDDHHDSGSSDHGSDDGSDHAGGKKGKGGEKANGRGKGQGYKGGRNRNLTDIFRDVTGSDDGSDRPAWAGTPGGKDGAGADSPPPLVPRRAICSVISGSYCAMPTACRS